MAMKMFFPIRQLALACLGLVTAAGLNVMVADPAGATIIDTFALTSDHCTGGGCLPLGIPSAGTVTVTEVSGGTLQYNVALNPGFYFLNTGFDASFGFNLDRSPITVTDLSSGFTLNSTVTGTVHIDGFGDFDYGVTCTSCGPGASTALTNPTSLTLDVTAAAGLFLTPPPTGDVTQSTGGSQIPQPYFAADVYSSATGNTGAVDASVVSTPNQQLLVPEPSAIALFGVGLIAFGFSFRRRCRNRV